MKATPTYLKFGCLARESSDAQQRHEARLREADSAASQQLVGAIDAILDGVKSLQSAAHAMNLPANELGDPGALEVALAALRKKFA